MKKFLLVPFLTFFFIVTVFFYLLSIERNPSELPSVLLDKDVPEFQADSLLSDEKFLSNKEFQNEIIIVNFFATWCKPCRDEHVYIKRLAEKNNIKIIGINYKDDENKTLKWLNELGNPYSNIAIDKNGRIAIEWGVYGIPETFIVDSKGKIKLRHVGPITNRIYNDINSKIEKIK